jgi:hypothetical protein
MPKSPRNLIFLPPEDTLFSVKKRKAVPHEFVLDALAPLSPTTRHMFGCLAVYVGDKIVLVLRDKPSYAEDNGVWLATTKSTTRVCGGTSRACDPFASWARR